MVDVSVIRALIAVSERGALLLPGLQNYIILGEADQLLNNLPSFLTPGLHTLRLPIPDRVETRDAGHRIICF